MSNAINCWVVVSNLTDRQGEPPTEAIIQVANALSDATLKTGRGGRGHERDVVATLLRPDNGLRNGEANVACGNAGNLSENIVRRITGDKSGAHAGIAHAVKYAVNYDGSHNTAGLGRGVPYRLVVTPEGEAACKARGVEVPAELLITPADLPAYRAKAAAKAAAAAKRAANKAAKQALDNTVAVDVDGGSDCGNADGMPVNA